MNVFLVGGMVFDMCVFDSRVMGSHLCNHIYSPYWEIGLGLEC